jgi:hypothetical protein
MGGRVVLGELSCYGHFVVCDYHQDNHEAMVTYLLHRIATSYCKKLGNRKEEYNPSSSRYAYKQSSTTEPLFQVPLDHQETNLSAVPSLASWYIMRRKLLPYAFSKTHLSPITDCRNEIRQGRSAQYALRPD